MKAKYLFTAFVLFSEIASSQIPSYVPTNGLKGFWPFSNSAADISGYNNNGTVNGPLPTADRYNAPLSAYSFDGNGDYITTTMTGILGNNPRAVSFWAKTNDQSSEMAAVQWGDEQSFPNHGVRFECAFNVGNTGPGIVGADCAVTYSSSNFADNNWHHYVYQFSSGEINQVEIYQDTKLLTQHTYTHNPDATLSTSNVWPVSFGHIPYYIPHFFNGSLDEIGIWDRVLTPCEIHELYTSSKTTLTISASNATFCPAQSVTLTAGGSVNSFTWSTGQNGSAVKVTPSGTTVFSVTGTNAVSGCQASAAFTLSTGICTGIASIENEQNAPEIYPNPSPGEFSVKVQQPTLVTVSNLLGQCVIEVTHVPANDNVVIRELPEGVYIVRGKTHRSTWEKKVVIRK